MTQEFLNNTFEYKNGETFYKSNGKRSGSRNQTTGYWQLSIEGKFYSEHVIIWIMHKGEIPKGKRIDHKDHTRDNNKIENLRLSTRSQNAMNLEVHKDNWTGFKGVSFDKRRDRYYARININGKDKYLGSFKTPEEANEVYRDYALLYHGEFSNYSKT